MDNNQLLDAFKEHLDEKINLVRSDLKEVITKQNGHEIRIDRLENMAGYIKVTVVTAFGAIGSLIAYLSYKLIDFWAQKS